MNEEHGTVCVQCGKRLCTTDYSDYDGQVHCDCELDRDGAEYSDGYWYCEDCADIAFGF